MARHIIDVIVVLLLNNITQLAQSVWVLEICKFIGNGYAISGRVQGVGYRYSARNYAEKLSLVGWVKNRNDDKVEMIAEGDKITLEQLLSWTKQGPRFADVSNVEVKQHAATGEFLDFSVR